MRMTQSRASRTIQVEVSALRLWRLTCQQWGRACLIAEVRVQGRDAR